MDKILEATVISIFLSVLLCSCATTPSVIDEARATEIAKKTFNEILPKADTAAFDWDASREYNKWGVRASSRDGGENYRFELRMNGEPVLFRGPGFTKKFYLVSDPFLPSSLNEEEAINAAKDQLFKCFPLYSLRKLLWQANRTWNAWAIRFDALGGHTSDGEPALVMGTTVFLTLSLDGKLVSMRRTHGRSYSQEDLESLAAKNETLIKEYRQE